jgi:SOS response regulatory protein OraA/RecX
VSPVVTALHERPRGRVEVQLDGAPWRLVPADAVVRTGLFVGRALDRETARTLGRELRRADALGRALRALGPRDRSRRALADRLTRAGVRVDAREEALTRLEETGLVDDARVAMTRARSLAERSYGDAAIRYDLEREGVASELVEDALAGLEPEPARARALVERRGAEPKTARWLASRGFEAATVEEAVGGFAEEA